MIVCPKCSKEIADDSAHCGYCGQEIKAKIEKKTMFGMAALDGAVLQKAIAEAQAAKDDAQASAKGLKLPKPGGLGGQGAPTPSTSGSSPGLKLPKPGEATLASGVDVEDPDDMGLAKTEMLEFSDEARAELREAAATLNLASPSEGDVDDLGFSDEDANGPTMPHTLPDFKEPAGDAGFGTHGGFGTQGGFGPQGGFDEPAPAPVTFDEPPSTGPVGGFSTPQAPSLPATTDGEPAKSKKGLYIGIAAVVFVLGSGCFLTIMWQLYQMITG